MIPLSGCANNGPATQQTTQYLGQAEPLVISGDPAQDTAALRAADGQLDRVRWDNLDDLGPDPAWKQFGGERPGPIHPQDAPAPIAATPATQPAQSLDPSQLPVHITELPDGRLRFIWTLRSYGGSRVTSKMDGGTSRRNITLAPPELAQLVDVIKANVGDGGTVAALPLENTLIITCRPESRDLALGLLADLDRPAPQVQIAAKVFEVTSDFDFQQGAEILLNHVAGDGTQTALSRFSAQRALENGGTDAPFQGSVISLMQEFQSAGLSLEASFQLLADAGLIRVVSAPRMTVAVGQTGYLLAGQELPVQSSEIVGNNIRTSTTYKPVGVQLYITPQAVGDDRVKLHTISVVSSIAGFVPGPTLAGKNAPLINPIINTREAETAVTVDNGSTLVISGLRMVRTTTRENKIPGLGDLPVLGWLFKNHRTQQQLTDLYFFVTPTLM